MNWSFPGDQDVGRALKAGETIWTKTMRCENMSTFSSHRSVWLKERGQEIVLRDDIRKVPRG